MNKNNLGRFVSSVVSVVMVASIFTTSALAVGTVQAEKAVSYSSNEYDIYMELKSKDTNQLKQEGFSITEIETIQNNEVEAELLERAQLSEKELKEYGYSSRQIKILKEYDGSPLEFTPEMRAIMATFSGAIRRDSSSASRATVIFNWSWSNAPIVCLPGLKDFAVCAWQGTNRSNQQSIMRVEGTNCTVTYADGRVRQVSVSIQDRLKWVKADIEQNDGRSWAKSGALSVQVRQEYTTNDLYSTVFTFGFGHATLAINGGVSVDSTGPSVGISFGWKVEDMFNRDLTVYH